MKNINLRWATVTVLILMAAATRLLPHPPNMTAVGAMALFGGAYFSNRFTAVLMPLVALFLSDLFLNNVVYAAYTGGKFVWFYDGALWIYGSVAAAALIGAAMLRHVSVKNVVVSSLFCSLLFFIVTNYGVWSSGAMYPKTGAGLAACYTAALPFFGNSLVGDLLFSAFCSAVLLGRNGGFQLWYERK